jgi:hypothetical protein
VNRHFDTRCMVAVLVLVPAIVPAFAVAQPAPVEERAVTTPSGRLPLQQQRIGAAYGAMQQAIYDAQLAEQDYTSTQDAYQAAQQRADALKAELGKVSKARDAAKAHENAMRKAYDDELRR